MTEQGDANQLNYPWYELVSGLPMQQGDCFVGIPVLLPIYPEQARLNSPAIDIDIKTYDVIVLSQSCDLLRGKIDNVILCPVYDLSVATEFIKPLGNSKGRNEARQGKLPPIHVLGKCSINAFEREVRVVNFAQTLTVPFNYLTQLAEQNEPRIRLLPPYREHLSQAFARFVMRVGLPQDIEEF